VNFSENKIKIFIITLSVVLIFLFGTIILLPINRTHSQNVTGLNEDKLVLLANKNRLDIGLSPLTYDINLQQAAIAKAKDMASNDYFEHFSPAGKTPWEFMVENNYSYTIAGENLAMDFTSENDIEQAWLDSPTHRANILNPEFENIAIAVEKDNFEGRETYLVVQMFGKKNQGLSATTNLLYYKIKTILGFNF